ncbi:unnamed protein product [Prorocentrum cordatum]|uniref:Uncharacterized protein n=1 Tax=Prorocentrum cordatum TaxID=2364126 RepID=A0ABN9RF21_9DINO|nr:unnamed protein product [Polarella glacialis]
MQSRPAGLGIASNLESSAAGDNDFIGFTLVGSSGEWRPKSSQFRRLKLASDYLLEVRPSITGQELERFVGHVTALFSLSPELLCLMEKHQEELEISGASEATILGLGRARAFAEVPASLVERGWAVAYAGRWRGVPGPQVHLEARARTWTVRHVARDCSLHNSRVLLLGDNMSVILARAKGRSSTPAMNFQCRLSSAIALAVGLKPYDRWAPSELNALDAASRVHQPRHGGRAKVAVHARYRLPAIGAVAACGPARAGSKGRAAEANGSGYSNGIAMRPGDPDTWSVDSDDLPGPPRCPHGIGLPVL